MPRFATAAFLWAVATARLLGAQSGAAAQALERAIELAGNGDVKAAEAAAREAIRVDPGFARSYAFLGVVLTKQERLEEANGYLEEALRIDPAAVSTRFNLALNQFRLGRTDAAGKNLEIVLKGKPDHAPAALLLGTILAGADGCSRAVPLLESVLELTLRQPDSAIALGRCYYSGKQREKAREILLGLRTHPAGAEAAYPAAMLAMQAHDIETANDLLEALRPRYGQTTEFAYVSALLEYNTGRFADAQSRLEPLVAGGIKDANVFDLLAWCRRRQGHNEEAVAAMEEAIRLEPATGVRHLHLAQMWMEDKKYRDAYAAAKQATAGSAAGSQAYKLRGDAEFALGMLKQAEESYSRAVSLNNHDADALLQLAITQHELWKYADAKRSFEAGIVRFADDARFFLAYGKLLLDPAAPAAIQAAASAVSSLERALQLNAALSDAHYELGKYRLRTGQPAAAIAHLETAAKLDPGNGQVHLALANAYRAVGRADAAAEQVKLYKSAARE